MIPNALALFKVAQACGVTAEWLFTGKASGVHSEGTPMQDTPPGYALIRLPNEYPLTASERDLVVGFVTGHARQSTARE